MLIRHARPDDGAALSALSAELGYPVEAEVMAERVRDMPHDHVVFVTTHDNEVTGWIDVGLSFHLQSGIKAVIGGMVVASGQRSRGIGSQLLRRAEQWAREHRATNVTLRSNMKRTDAHRFYQRENYELIK